MRIMSDDYSKVLVILKAVIATDVLCFPVDFYVGINLSCYILCFRLIICCCVSIMSVKHT